MPTKIHFVNVGHGDCTIIEHPSGRRTMIDINNGGTYDETTASELENAYPVDWFERFMAAKEGRQLPPLREQLSKAGYKVDLTDPVEYYLNHWGRSPIFRYIQSHPDMDHMRGLAALRKAGIPITNFWDTGHVKEITEFNEGDEEDWREYERLRKGNGQNGTPTVLRLKRGDKRPFFNQDPEGVDGGDGLHILAPTPTICTSANDCEDWNSHSYVLWLYHAGKRVILGGDATESVWKDLHECGTLDLQCDVLKASHHGRESGYHSAALKAMSPSYIIVSVGKRPDTDCSFKYKNACPNVLSTREFGNMLLTIDDNGIISVEKQHPPTLPLLSLYDLAKQSPVAFPTLSEPIYQPPQPTFTLADLLKNYAAPPPAKPTLPPYLLPPDLPPWMKK